MENLDFVCIKCERRFLTEIELNAHTSSHLFKCDICMQSFVTCQFLATHHATHFMDDTECPLSGCRSAFKDYVALTKHIENYHKDVKLEEKSVNEVKVTENKSDPFICSECGASFDSYYKLLLHFRETFHDGNKIFTELYKCNSCSTITKNFNEYLRHCVKHTDSYYIQIDKAAVTLYQCKECNDVFNTYECLLDHLISKHGDQQEKPNTQTKNVVVIKREIKIENEKLEEESLQQSFENGTNTVQESNIDLDPDNYLVEFLEDEISTPVPEYDMKIEYLESDENENEVEEKMMDSEFSSSLLSNKENDKERVRGPKRAKVNESSKGNLHCDKCSASFLDNSELNEHMKKHTCEICNKVFKTVTYLAEHNLRLHVKKIRGRAVHRCSKCGKTFKKFGPFRSHNCEDLQISRTCQKCGETFKDSNEKREHMRMHAEMGHFDCKVCNKKFKRLHHLLHHERQHDRSNILTCSACMQTFPGRKVYQEHIKKCSADSKMVCKICGFSSFKEESSYLIHLKRHEGGNIYACELCGIEFKLRRDLRSHVLTHMEVIDGSETEIEDWAEEYLSDGFVSE